MPTYEYECKKCGHVFETIQSITSEPLKRCPKQECPDGSGKGSVRRLIGSGGGLLFKGSGFYITDYRSDSYKAAAKADGGASKSPSKDADGGSGKSTTDKKSKPSSSPATPKTGDG